MQTILAWILVGLVIAGTYPAAARLLARGKRQDGFWLTAAVSLGLSTGTLTLIMFWEAILGIGWSVLGITLPYFGVMGLIVWGMGNPPPNSLSLKGLLERDELRPSPPAPLPQGEGNKYSGIASV